MKRTTYSRILRSAAATSLIASAFLLSACSDDEQASFRAERAADNTREALSDTWDNIKDYTYEKREDFADSAKAMSSRLEAESAELRAEVSGAQASASRKAAWEEFKSSQADFDDKVDALGQASSDTWDQAKDEVKAAWERVEAAYHKAVAD